MKKTILILLCVMLLLTLAFPGIEALAENKAKNKADIHQKEYCEFIADNKDACGDTRLLVISETEPDKLNSTGFLHCFGNAYLIQFPDSESAENALAVYRAQSSVISAEYDKEVEATDSVTTGSGGMSWGSEAIGYNSSFISKFNLSPLYAVFLPRVRVAVIDSGIDYNNNNLDNRIEKTGFNVSGSNTSSGELDDYGHGTEVATIIADNTPINVKLRAYKVVNSSGTTSVSKILYGIQQAIDDGVDIINISLSFSGSGLTNIINEAYDNGILTVVSAGNSHINAANVHPANVEKALTVAAMTENDTVSSVSGYGKAIDLIAPGDSIKTWDKVGTTQYFNGCSPAAAFVSAAAAIVKTKNQKATPQEISDFLIINGRNINPPDLYYNAPALYLGNIKSFDMIQRPANPKISIESGTYMDSITVSITSSDESDVYYEIWNYNESAKYSGLQNPIKYTQPIELTEKCNLVAVCKKDYPNITLESETVFESYFFDYTNAEDYFSIDENGTISEYKGRQNNVYVPDTVNGIAVTAIGNSVFEVSFQNMLDKEKNFLRTIRLPDTCTIIGTRAFEYCKFLTTVEANNITRINSDAFDECNKLENINLDNLTYVGDHALATTKIKEISNSNLVYIGDGAFRSCSELTSADLPNVKTVGDYAFNYCYNLQEINVPSLQYACNGAFMYCAMDYIYLPEAISIDENAFYKCPNLTTVEIGKVEDICNGAFYQCDALTDVYFLGTKSEWNNIIIEDNNESLLNAKIHYFDEPFYSVSGYVGYLAGKDASEGTLSTKRQLQDIIITTVVDGETVTADYDNSTGQFTFAELPNGTYEASVSYSHGLDRTFTIIVNGTDVESETVIGLVTCNFNNADNNVNANDLKVFTPLIGTAARTNPELFAQYQYLDVNCDNNINANDLKILRSFLGVSGRTFNYKPQTIA